MKLPVCFLPHDSNSKGIKQLLHTPVFIAALFTVVKTWKQPKCPSPDEWIKKIWYMYTMEYYSAIKRNDS